MLIQLCTLDYGFQEMCNGPTLKTIKSWLPKNIPFIPCHITGVTKELVQWVFDFWKKFGYTGGFRICKDDSPVNGLLGWDPRRRRLVGVADGESPEFTDANGAAFAEYIQRELPRVRIFLFHSTSRFYVTFNSFR